MKNQFHRAALVATLALLLLPAGSWGQDANDRGDRFRDRIDHNASLTETQRSRMRDHLQKCKDVGMTSEQLDAMFTDGGSHLSGEVRLRMQELVLELAADGQPYDLLCNKIAEGEMKRARERDVERAVQRMGEYVGAAHQYMQQAKRDGVAGLDDAGAEQHLQRGLAMNMWRGLQQDELDRLRTHAQGRLRDGSCDLIDLTAAAETTTELKEIGVGSELAVGLCGDALREGYAAVDMRHLGRMAIVANRNGESRDQFCGRLRDLIRRHSDLGDIQHMMVQDGWMGPESMGHGSGGHSPVDDVMGGHHHGGMGGHHDGGGMGGHK